MVSSVRGGSSLNTALFVRRRMNGRIKARSASRAAGLRSRSMDRQAALEAFARAEQAGIDGVEQAPKFVEIVLDRRAAQGDAELGLELLAGLSALGVGVLRFCASSSTSIFQAGS